MPVAAGDLEWDLSDTFTLKVGGTWKKYVNDGQEYRRNSEFAIPRCRRARRLSHSSSTASLYY